MKPSLKVHQPSTAATQPTQNAPKKSSGCSKKGLVMLALVALAGVAASWKANLQNPSPLKSNIVPQPFEHDNFYRPIAAQQIPLHIQEQRNSEAICKGLLIGHNTVATDGNGNSIAYKPLLSDHLYRVFASRGDCEFGVKKAYKQMWSHGDNRLILSNETHSMKVRNAIVEVQTSNKILVGPLNH